MAAKADKVHELAERIGESLAKAEQLGAEGLVDESMKLMEEIENLRKQKSEAESEYRASIPAATYQQQKLRVCEVCCAYLGIHDNDRRLADHFGGKLHLGFIKIRDTLKEYQVCLHRRLLNILLKLPCFTIIINFALRTLLTKDAAKEERTTVY